MIRFKPVEVSCEYCGKKKFKKVSALKTNPTSFCSQICLKRYRNKTIKVLCKECNIEFIKKDNKNSKNHFCSSRCFHKNNTNEFIMLCCDFCDIFFNRKQNEIKNQVYHFCKTDCYQHFSKKNTNKKVNPKNSRIMIETVSGLKKVNSYRNKTISKHGYKCQNPHCLLEQKNIKLDNCQYEVDHKNDDRTDNSEANLQVLCCYCHALKTRKVNLHDK